MTECRALVYTSSIFLFLDIKQNKVTYFWLEHDKPWMRIIFGDFFASFFQIAIWKISNKQVFFVK